MAKAVTIIIDKKELFKGKLAGDLQDSISECIEKIDEIKSHLRQLVKSLWPDYDWMTHVMTWEWECEKSPFGWCAYDYQKDRVCDHCLFCSNPSERK